MMGFLAKRLLQAIFVIVVVTLLVSWAVRLTGDPSLMLAQGAGSVTEQDLINIRKHLGLDQPFSQQYFSFVSGLLVGDFGRSFLGGTSVSQLIADALPATLLLTFCSLALSLLGWQAQRDLATMCADAWRWQSMNPNGYDPA